MKRTLAAVALFLGFTLSASALQLTGRDIVIPSAGRTPGVNGTMWQTDLILTNLTPSYSTLTLHVVFLSGGESGAIDVQVPRYGTVVLRDFVRTRFGAQQGLGMVRVMAGPTDAIIAARAWVYHTGGGLELGQNVQGVEYSSLKRTAFVPGLSATGGNRSNLGIANPNGSAASIAVTGYDESGAVTRTANLVIPANGTYQSDLISIFGSAARTSGLTAAVTSDVPVYAFGSVVRDTSGDPYFVMGAEASDLSGRELVIPLAGRAPGGHGTEWKTDLILSNLSPNHPSLTVRVDFLGETREVSVPRYGTVILRDFGRGLELGLVRVSAEPADAVIAARAWVYNHGGGVELGQNVQGLRLDSLPRQIVIPSLSIADGNRANFGVANPGDTEAVVTVDVEHLNRRNVQTIRVAPRSVAHLDIASFIDQHISDPNGVTLRIDSTEPVYAYGSVIRNAGGDPYFVTPEAHRAIAPLAPPCANPAPLYLHEIPAPGYIFLFHFRPDIDARAVTLRLAATYGFTPTYIYDAIGGFSAELTPEMVAGIRCEPEVRFGNQNAYGWVDD